MSLEKITPIARKTCGGSQSDKALMTREVMQSVIESLRLRHPDPVGKLEVSFALLSTSGGRNGFRAFRGQTIVGRL